MSADLLREAATAIRWETANDGFDPRTGFALAVADWLDMVARNLTGIPGQTITPSPYEENALAVARAYLGSDQ